MPTGTDLPTDRLLVMAQLLSPAFPTGGFAYSQGLEWAIRARWVRDAASLQDWLSALLTDGVGRNDAILIHVAAGCDEPAPVIVTALATATARERRVEMMDQGAAFARTVRAVWGHDIPDGPLPVIIGLTSRAAGLPPAQVAALHLQALVTTLVQAAQRLMPLGQTAAQGVVAALAPLCRKVAEGAAGLGLDDLGGAALMADLAAMRHETQEPRLFRS
jgi:urease accessory protein